MSFILRRSAMSVFAAAAVAGFAFSPQVMAGATSPPPSVPEQAPQVIETTIPQAPAVPSSTQSAAPTPSSPSTSTEPDSDPGAPGDASSNSSSRPESSPSLPSTRGDASIVPDAPGKRLAPAAVAAGCQTYPPTSFQVCGRIRDKYNQTGGPTGFLLFPKSNELTNPGNTGKRSEFLGGNIYWSAATDAHPVAHEFLTKWGEKGYESGYMKYPTTDEIVLADGVNRRQEYQGGQIYWAAGIGAHTIQGAILDKWKAMGAEGSYLGFPTSDEKVAPDGKGRYNTFQHGSMYWSPTTGAHAVSGEIMQKWADAGYEAGQYGYPTNDQTSPDDGVTVKQTFKGGTITAAGPKVVELAGKMPGATPQQVLDDANRAIQGTSADLKDAVASALEEIAEYASGGPGNGQREAIPTGRATGDLVVSNSDTLGVPHGHTGIYVSATESVHAFNAERGTILIQSNDSQSGELFEPAQRTVDASGPLRSAAAAWARTRIGSGYNFNFAFNKRDWKPGEVGTYNCSQLVWGAYMNASNGQFDLDANGGYGVYPKNIINSPKVHEYQ